jgi:hypothetical protein
MASLGVCLCTCVFVSGWAWVGECGYGYGCGCGCGCGCRCVRDVGAMLGSSTPQWSLQGVCETCVHTYHTAVLSDTVFVWRLGQCIGPRQGPALRHFVQRRARGTELHLDGHGDGDHGHQLVLQHGVHPPRLQYAPEKNFHPKLNHQLYIL